LPLGLLLFRGKQLADVSGDDFTVESTGELPPDPPSTPDVPAELPDTSTEPAPGDEEIPPAAAASAEPEAKPAGERNPDGTFKKAKKDPQARIDHVTWEREEARREAQAARAEAEDLKRRISAYEASQRQPASPQGQPRGTADPTDPEPNPEDTAKYPEGQYDRQYLKDQARWEARDEFRKQSQAAAQRAYAQQRQQHQAQREASYGERMQAVLSTDPQFIERLHPMVQELRPTSRLQSGETPNQLNDLAEEMLDSPHVAQLQQHFSDHLDDLRRFASLPTRRALLQEFTKLETRFEAAPAGSAPKTPVLSQAKPPIRPVGSAPPAVEDEGSDDEPFEVFVKRENARARRR
jgi:hypothetical protein